MKGRLAFEVFGENIRSQIYGLEGLFKSASADKLFKDAIGKPPHPYWVAEIIDTHPIYKYERKFLPKKLDYTHANSVGSRGIIAEYILESEKVYEVKQQITWKQSRRYFCAVSDDGDVIEIPETYVQEFFEGRA